MSSPTQAIELRTRSVGPWPMNTYALVCPTTKQSVLIDPGADPDTLQEMLEGTTPIAILLTHTHPDHLGALDEMLARLDVPLMAHASPHVNGITLDALTLMHGDKIAVGEQQITVYETPGHTVDMLTFMTADHKAIVGDTIFAGGPGKTWSAEGFQQTLNTLREWVLQWPDDTVCYAGHGPSFRLGDKRAAIEAFLAKDHGDFFGDASWE